MARPVGRPSRLPRHACWEWTRIVDERALGNAVADCRAVALCHRESEAVNAAQSGREATDPRSHCRAGAASRGASSHGCEGDAPGERCGPPTGFNRGDRHHGSFRMGQRAYHVRVGASVLGRLQREVERDHACAWAVQIFDQFGIERSWQRW